MNVAKSEPAIAELAFPSASRVDSTLAFLSEGYEFVSNRCRRLATDAFQTRLLGKRVICMRGADAARFFYGQGAFTRHGAMPPTTLRLLQDKGSVQTLDGAPHRWRKQLFMDMMSRERVSELTRLVEAEWRSCIPAWGRRGRVVLHDEVRGILCRAVSAWAGIPPGEDMAKRTRELGAMIDGAGSVGTRMAIGLALRARSEHWARGIIDGARDGSIIVARETPLFAIAFHEDERGARLDRKVAAVELLNVLRPTVAVARFITFAALALHEHPDARRTLGDDASYVRFAQEVRRYYPFFPVVGGRAKRPLEFRGHRLEKGAWVLFDLYGTNHDARIWDEPYVFSPDRFLAREPGAFDLVPQGAGEHLADHRCPGEDITIALTARVTRLLVEATDYAVPSQDLHVDKKKIPALPASGFVIAGARAKSRSVDAE